MASISDEKIVVLELNDPSAGSEENLSPDEISISTFDIEDWDLDSILSSKIVRVHANRSRYLISSLISELTLSERF